MYLGVDVGGTKTLLAVFTKNGKLRQSARFETPQNYSRFLDALTTGIKELGIDDYQAACIAVPGKIDRDKGVGITFGNLPWKNIRVVDFLEKQLKTPVIIENDAKLAGLYEAINIKDEFNKVLFVTVSTGVGIALIVDGKIDTDTNDLGGAAYPVLDGRKLLSLDKFTSGKAIAKEYGKRASEIDDRKTWQEISRDMAKGLVDIISLLEPEVVVIGGGVGTHFKKFGNHLKTELKKFELPVLKIPPIRQAKKPEEAVIYGCYELLKDRFGG